MQYFTWESWVSRWVVSLPFPDSLLAHSCAGSCHSDIWLAGVVQSGAGRGSTVCSGWSPLHWQFLWNLPAQSSDSALLPCWAAGSSFTQVLCPISSPGICGSWCLKFLLSASTHTPAQVLDLARSFWPIPNMLKLVSLVSCKIFWVHYVQVWILFPTHFSHFTQFWLDICSWVSSEIDGF